jgi:hypothetical protein
VGLGFTKEQYEHNDMRTQKERHVNGWYKECGGKGRRLYTNAKEALEERKEKIESAPGVENPQGRHKESSPFEKKRQPG